jgi:large repetitive protein
VRGLPGQFRVFWLAILLPVFAGVAYPQLTLTPSTPLGTAPGTYALPGGFTTKLYSGVTIFTNGNGPTTWSEKGALPPGLSFNPGPTNTATITGTPTTTGTFVFVVSAADPEFGGASQQYSISVATLLAITTQLTLPNATLGGNYIVTFAATGGTPPYNWFLAGGLTAGPSPTPPGLVLSRAGQLTGVPTQTGTFKFTVQVTDSDPTNSQSSSAVFSLTVNPAPTISGAGALPGGAVGVAYQTTLVVQGGSPPFTWTLQTTSVAPGLSLSTSGVIAGIPTQAGNFALTVIARDLWGASVSANYTLAVTTPLAITTQSLPDGTVRTPYPAQKITATGGTPPYTFSMSGSLPPGLALDFSTGAIMGIPVEGGRFAFTIFVIDSAGKNASRDFVVNITAIVFLTTSLPDGIVGTPYYQTIGLSGSVPPETFTVDSGALPKGIALNANTLSGTPTVAGVFQFVLRVNDQSGNTATQAYQLTVVLPAPAPTITGVTATEPPAQQPTASVQLANPYPLDLNVTITLTFASAVGSVDDPAIVFSNGKRTAQITIPAGTTVSPNVTFSTGTVAGTITLTLSFQAGGQNVTPAPAPTSVVQIPAAVPVITNVTATRNSSGIEVDVTGFSNTRDMTSAAFTFQASAGTNLQTSQVTVSTAGQLFTTWFSDPTSTQYGSRFTFAQQFSISGNLTGITGVSATLTNKQGTSNSMSASVQ